ncbi:hypothetical protein [Streptomyces sp. CA-106131]
MRWPQWSAAGMGLGRLVWGLRAPSSIGYAAIVPARSWQPV